MKAFKFGSGFELLETRETPASLVPLFPTIQPVLAVSTGGDNMATLNMDGQVSFGIDVNDHGTGVDLKVTYGAHGWAVVGNPGGGKLQGLTQAQEGSGPGWDDIAKALVSEEKIHDLGFNNAGFLPTSPAAALGLPPDNPVYGLPPGF